MKMHPLAVQEFRDDLASEYTHFEKGSLPRSIDREATKVSQDRAITAMDPIVISVPEGDLIRRKGVKVTAIRFGKI